MGVPLDRLRDPCHAAKQAKLLAPASSALYGPKAVDATARDSLELPLTSHVVLVQPQIHWNTGNAGRTCLALGAALHLVEPLGFSIEEREVKRAGLDYWQHVDLRVWPSLEAFEEALPEIGEPYFFSTKATTTFWDAPLGEPESVVLIFGRETAGLPSTLHERYASRFVTMPILSTHVRSLNLSTSVAVALYEVERQRRLGGP